MRPVKWKKVLGFKAGPYDSIFYSCDRHKNLLDKGDVSNFFSIGLFITESMEEDDSIECYFCRGEEGPAYDNEN